MQPAGAASHSAKASLAPPHLGFAIRCPSLDQSEFFQLIQQPQETRQRAGRNGGKHLRKYELNFFGYTTNCSSTTHIQSTSI